MSGDGAGGESKDRARIIQTVRTPLMFFVLIALVLEALSGLMVSLSQGQHRTYAIVGTFVLNIALIVIVALLSVFRPESLSGNRPAAIAKSKNQQLAEVLADRECREQLRAIFRTCLEEYVTGKRKARDIEKGFGLTSGTLAEIMKLYTLIIQRTASRRARGKP